MGDTEGARETQLEFVEFLSDTADAVPAVGHVKGGIHYVCGDKEGGDKAMKSSSRTTGVLGGGVVGFAVGGSAGAFAGGIAGGLAVDTLTTGIDSAIHNEFHPSGTIAAVDVLVGGKSESVSGDVFDLVVGTALDGVAGIGAGEQVGRMSKVHVEGEASAARYVPTNKQRHVRGALDDIKELKGDNIRKMKNEAYDHSRAIQEVRWREEAHVITVRQRRREIWELNNRREMHTNHNVHGLTEDYLAIDDREMLMVGGVLRDSSWRIQSGTIYCLQVVEYLDDHHYRRLEPRPGPSAGTRAANFIADHEAVYGAAAAVYPVLASPKGLIEVDFLFIGAAAAGIASANRAAKLGKSVA